MIHTVLAKQTGRHESSCTINVMCTKAQRKRIQAYVHEGREDKDQSLIMGRTPQSKDMTRHTKIPINPVTEICNVTLSQ